MFARVVVRVSGVKLLKCTWRLDGVDREGTGERYKIAREMEIPEQREERLKRNGDIIRDYRRL